MSAEDPRVQTIRAALTYQVSNVPGDTRTWIDPSVVAALDSLAADLEAAREALERITETTDGSPVRDPKTPYQIARAALARLSAGKETGDE